MLSHQLAVNVFVDWAANGSYTDESGRLRRLSVERGRSDANDVPTAATGEFVLSNYDGRYSPFNLSSPLAPNILPGRPVIVTAEYGASTVTLFIGKATPRAPMRGVDSEITFSMIDIMEDWSKPPLTNTPLSSGVLVSDLIAEVLDDIGFDPLGADLDTSEHALAYWTNHNRIPLNAMRLLAKENLGGMFFVLADGTPRFENSVHRSVSTTYAVLDGTFANLAPEVRYEDIVDSVRATYPRLEMSAVEEVVYTLNPVGKRLVPGLNTFTVDFSGLGTTGHITPEAGTDYVANSAPDGTGTDKTAQVVVDAFVPTGGGATITLDNLDSSDVYLITMQVRAFVVQSGNEVSEVVSYTAAPIVQYVRQYEDFEFQDDAVEVRAWTEYQAERLGQMAVRCEVEIVPDTDELMEAVLFGEISKRVYLVDTGAPWLTQVDGSYFIENIRLEFDAEEQNRVLCRWLLFDERLGEGDGFVINDDVSTTWPESIILDDAQVEPERRVIFK